MLVDKEVENIIKKLPSNYEITKSILNNLKNNKTKIVEMDEIKGNYYSFINDTIYISNKSKNANDHNRGIVIAHECSHSMQNKVLQLLNTIISNLMIILVLITIIMSFFEKESMSALIMVAIFNIVVREYLELNAVKKSLPVFLNYAQNLLSELELIKLKNFFEKEIKKAKIIYFFKIILDKSIPILIVLIISLVF